MRQLGTRIYLGLQKYSDAIRHIESLIQMKYSSEARKIELYSNMLNILLRFGSSDSALSVADKLATMTTDSGILADALLIKAKNYHKKNNRAELIKIAKKELQQYLANSPR